MIFNKNLFPLLTLAAWPCVVSAEGMEPADSAHVVTRTVTTTSTETVANTTNSQYADGSKGGFTLQSLVKKADMKLKFGGYIVGKYSANDRNGQASNSSFDLRFVRLYLNGYCFNDFYYRLQMEVNDAPGNDKGPRIVDAFVEWQHFDAFRVKLGQFKRPFGFENPYSPLDVGMGTYSQATMKLASIADRCGEHKSSGRDVGAQVQGDLFSAADGHKYFHYQVGLFNGQGINHKDADHHKDLIGGLWFSPVKDLAIGAFGWDGKYTNEKWKDNEATQRESVHRVRWAAGMKYESRWTVRSEYMSSVGGVTTDINAPRRSDAWYATVGVPVAKNWKCYGRWDAFRADKTWGSLKNDYGFSANYSPVKNLIFQLNYTRTYDRGAAIGRHYNTVDFQLYARF